ncbi:MAG TPA: hypothetical protein VGF67_12160 [Ktedonobacteraceae bacterium]|jgi:glutathione synthase/RimK-type ligase-like ATP-grasp enzyme
MGQEPILLDTDDIPLDADLQFCFPSDGSCWKGHLALQTCGRRVELETIRSVWWRRPGEYFGFPSELCEQEREFAREEIDQVLRGLWSLPDCYWVGYPEHIRQASWKVEQLRRATHYGFEVPRSLLTNNPDQVRAFYEVYNNQMIFKVLTDSFLAAPKVAEKHLDQPLPQARETKTTLITEAELEMIESVRLVPCLFQEYVPKQTELRVTVIGDELFPVEIYSQARQGTRVDWRNWSDGGLDIPYRKTTLPADVAERCMKFVQSYQLHFSAIDFIRTPDERYVFIENNPTSSQSI